MIRDAMYSDVPILLEMSRKFYITTIYNQFTPMDDATVIKRIKECIDAGVMLVATIGDKIIGMVGLAVYPFNFNEQVQIANELVWWVDPVAQAKGVGQELLRAVDEACAVFDVVAIKMAKLKSSPPQVDEIYRKYGYIPSEDYWIKVT